MQVATVLITTSLISLLLVPLATIYRSSLFSPPSVLPATIHWLNVQDWYWLPNTLTPCARLKLIGPPVWLASCCSLIWSHLHVASVCTLVALCHWGRPSATLYCMPVGLKTSRCVFLDITTGGMYFYRCQIAIVLTTTSLLHCYLCCSERSINQTCKSVDQFNSVHLTVPPFLK